MEVSISFLLVQIIAVLAFSPCPSTAVDTLAEGSSLSVEQPTDTLVSENGVFSAGFFEVGENAFCFSIWFATANKPTVVWMANRDRPVNGKASKISVLKDGTLLLVDAGLITIWTAKTDSKSLTELKLLNNGNLVLLNLQRSVLWQSFDSPTDTLLPGQFLTEKSILISSKSPTNYSTGYYKFYFDTDNVLRMVFEGPTFSGIYWPRPWQLPLDASRSPYNISRTAVLDSYGLFVSSDEFKFSSSDIGVELYRRLVMDSDGQLRLYSLNEEHKIWEVTWEAVDQSCRVHGVCGPNSMCTYGSVLGRTCYCLQGYKTKNPHDLSQGCEPEFNFTCNKEEFGFLRLRNMEFYGYDIGLYPVSNLKQCEEMCLNLCDNCKGFQFKSAPSGTYTCYPKVLLLNGRDTPNFVGDIYLKLPKSSNFFHYNVSKHRQVDCLDSNSTQQLNIAYEKPPQNATLQILVWVACAIGGLEAVCIFLAWFFLHRSKNVEGRISATGLQRFTYGELRKATRGFKEEIGRGATGTVYKARLYDGRIAAIKYLNQTHHGQDHAEFVTEISTIGRLNHMNVIEMWGYCVEGKHRLLVYEFMENGSLTKNLASNTLDSSKRFSIAIGVAKGLAYLHEECLEWILHCDVKPENILLDSSYQPKVADFGLSKLLKRDEHGSSKFSKMRGTRGYIAPEWIYNLRITSKVDVYSYGMVVLEMVTGRSTIGMNINSPTSEGNVEEDRFVPLARERSSSYGDNSNEESVADIVNDGMMERQHEVVAQVAVMVKVALLCVQEDAEARPSMSQVVEMLLSFKPCK